MDDEKHRSRLLGDTKLFALLVGFAAFLAIGGMVAMYVLMMVRLAR